MTCALFRRTLAAGCKQGVRDMRLRLFERVRRLAHPRAGRLRPRRDRAGETARHDRPWEARPRAVRVDMHGQAVSVSTEATGRHRRNSQEITGPPAPGGRRGRQAAVGGPAWAAVGRYASRWPARRRCARRTGHGATCRRHARPACPPGRGHRGPRRRVMRPGVRWVARGRACAVTVWDGAGRPAPGSAACRAPGRAPCGQAGQPGGSSETAMARGRRGYVPAQRLSGRGPAYGRRGRSRPAPAALRARA